MIVDDAFFIRNLLRSILELAGYRVVAEAADGVEAVAKFREHRPAIILMDLIMPLLNGIEAAREIIALDGGVKIILCSSVGGEELAMSVKAAGALEGIEKPFTAEQVREVVGRLCC
jgi:two-component system chemotaxis response regulator CheY